MTFFFFPSHPLCEWLANEALHSCVHNFFIFSFSFSFLFLFFHPHSLYCFWKVFSRSFLSWLCNLVAHATHTHTHTREIQIYTGARQKTTALESNSTTTITTTSFNGEGREGWISGWGGRSCSGLSLPLPLLLYLYQGMYISWAGLGSRPFQIQIKSYSSEVPVLFCYLVNFFFVWYLVLWFENGGWVTSVSPPLPDVKSLVHLVPTPWKQSVCRTPFKSFTSLYVLLYIYTYIYSNSLLDRK